MSAKITGGAKLAAKLKELSKKVSSGADLRVGFMEGATYPDEKHTPVALVAWWLNYGTKTAPPRPFFTDVIRNESDRWGDVLAVFLQQTDFDVMRSMNLMGEYIEGQVSESLARLSAPPLSPITLMLRKMRIGDRDKEITGAMVGEAARRVAAGESTAGVSTKPGNYTGHLSRSITYDVTEK